MTKTTEILNETAETVNKTAETVNKTTQLLEKTTQLCDHKANEYSPLALAYIGDGVYEVFIRTYVLSKGNRSVDKLHRASRDFVCAHAQSELYAIIEPHLTEQEHMILKRGRNAKSISSPKNGDMTEYRRATGIEALIGYLYLDQQIERISQLIKIGLDVLVSQL